MTEGIDEIVTGGDRQPDRQLRVVPDPEMGGLAELRTAAHTRGTVNPAVNLAVNSESVTERATTEVAESVSSVVPDCQTSEVRDSQTPEVRQSQTPEVAEAEIDMGPAGPGWRARIEAIERWAHPPNVTVERPPSWEEIGWRAHFGDQVAVEGWTRTVAVGFAFAVAWPGRVLAFYLDWITRSPSRFFVAVVLYAALALTRPPYLGWLPFPLKGDL